MPELAEVEFYRKQWATASGQRVVDLRVNTAARVFRRSDTGDLPERLKGQVFDGSRAHGKRLFFRFGTAGWLGVHLGMSGRLGVQRRNFEAGRHDHFVIRTSRCSLVFSDPRMFGKIEFTSGNQPVPWKDLPPQPHDHGFTCMRLDAILDRRARAPLKTVLLLQEFFPGVGNWMADEILWRVRVRPDTPAGSIGPKKRKQLYGVVREVCHDALRVIGTDWSRPPDSWLFNHRWEDGGLCPKTGKALRREQIGGRTTCWSPSWQTYAGARGER